MVVELEASRAMPVSRRSVSPTPRKRTAEPHCDRLHGELGIDPDQAGPWTGFATALLANADRLDVEPEQHRWPKRSSTLDTSDDLEALDLVFGPREERVGALTTMRAAAKQLYAVLTPLQRQQADRLLPLCCLGSVETSGAHEYVGPVGFN